MLTYRDYVYSVMTDYNAAQVAVVTIPEQIETERSRRESLRAAKTDGDRVQGGEGQTDDAWLTSIAREDYLKARLDMSRHVIETVEEVLRRLDDEETEIVTRLILQRGHNTTARLAEDWGVDESTVFRAKSRVLKKLALMLTGEARA